MRLLESLACRFKAFIFHVSIQNLLLGEHIDLLDDAKQGHNTLQILGILAQRNTRDEQLTYMNWVVHNTLPRCGLSQVMLQLLMLSEEHRG